MEIKKLIKKAVLTSCVSFTLITAVYMLILQISNIENDAAAVEAPRVLLFFVASVLFAIANAIRSIQRLPVPLGYIFHYLICVFAFYACFLLPVSMRSSNIVTGIIIFTLIYAVIMGIVAAFKAKLHANREKDTTYKSQFKKQK